MDRFQTDSEELAWLVGLIEGEGSIGYSKGSIRLEIGSTDEDTVRRAASFLGSGVIGPYQYRQRDKPFFKTVLYGHGITEMLMKVYPHMSDHRKSQIRDALTAKLADRKKEATV